MAIMTDLSSSFDDASYLLSQNHDFLQHTASSHPSMSAKMDQQHQQMYEQFDQQHASTPSPPGNLSLAQLQSFDALHGSQPNNDHAQQHHADQVLQGWNAAQHHGSQDGSVSESQNSLGLLGSDFNQASASSTPPPLQRSSQREAQQQPFSQHLQHPQAVLQTDFAHSSPFTVDANHPMGNDATTFTNQAPWLRGANVAQTMGQGGATLHRQHSISSLSDASSSSVFNDGASIGSQSQFDPTSPVRTSFTPLQSPMGMSHSISSLAGLAIGTPQQQLLHANTLDDYGVAGYGGSFASSGASMFSGDDHEQLLSLSGMHRPSYPPSTAPMQITGTLMAPPSATSNANRRRSTGVAHTLYTGQVRQLRQDMGGLDDATPMPPSQQMFTGHPSSNEVSSLAGTSSSQSSTTSSQHENFVASDAQSEHNNVETTTRQPSTPRSARQAMHGVPQHSSSIMAQPNHAFGTAHFQTPQSHQGNLSSPADDSSAMGSSLTGSGYSAPRLTRMDSFDSFTTGSAISTPSSEAASVRTSGGVSAARSLEATIAEHEAKLAAAVASMNASTGGAQQDVDTSGDRTISPSSSGRMSMGTPLSTSMSRVSSAPAHHHQGHEFASMPTVPTTPVRSSGMTMGQSSFNGGQPFTPQHNTNPGSIGYHTPQMHPHHLQRIHELTMSAPHMAPSRSVGSLTSPGLLTSPLSPMDMHHHQQAAAAATAAATGGNPFVSPSSAVDDDGMIRSPSSGVARTATPRSKGRNAAPPPLIVSSADKLHVCYCGKRFKRLEHLKRHNRVHTQERPHPCPAPGCNKWFGRTDNLTQHLKTHYRTLGRTSESLLQITQAAAAAKANGPEARGLTGAVAHGGSGAHADASMGDRRFSDEGHAQQEARHDPHAAAAAAAAQAVSKTNMKRRITLSNDMLGGPITLESPSGSTSSRSPSVTKLDGAQSRLQSTSPQPGFGSHPAMEM